MSDKQRVLSCIQPTGSIHLGNYLGAILNYVDLQDRYICRYGVVDYHAMTMPYDPNKLRESTWKMAFQLLACGVKPENLFIQSLIPEHAELSWIFSCFASYGELSRMTQFKDKRDQIGEKDSSALVSTGLFTYPILQAADILVYRPQFVPVGKDQDQHLELSRTIAERFNKRVGVDYFPLPRTLHTEAPKILSLADPSRKMSKSLGEKHYIDLFGDANRARKQVRSAVTDSGDTSEGGMSPGVTNLFLILKMLSSAPAIHDGLMADFNAGTLRYSDLKDAVGDVVVARVERYAERLAAMKENRRQTREQIKDSSAEIRKEAQATLREVRQMTGLIPLRNK